MNIVEKQTSTSKKTTLSGSLRVLDTRVEGESTNKKMKADGFLRVLDRKGSKLL